MRKSLTQAQIDDRTRKRNSYTANVNIAKRLRGYGVAPSAIPPVLLEMHYLKRYKYGRNVQFAKESILLIKQDLENKIIQL